MSDRTMCADTACPRASQCRRSEQSGTEPDPHWQSWLLVSPRTKDGCLLFWATPEERQEVFRRAMVRGADGLPTRLEMWREKR